MKKNKNTKESIRYERPNKQMIIVANVPHLSSKQYLCNL